MEQMPAIASPEKRLVFVYADGRHEIGGVFRSDQLPSVIEVKVLDDGKIRTGAAGLIRVTTRAAYYKEITEPVTGRFDEFHPEQR
jgi:hypothetical protein